MDNNLIILLLVSLASYILFLVGKIIWEDKHRISAQQNLITELKNTLIVNNDLMKRNNQIITTCVLELSKLNKKRVQKKKPKV